MVLAYPFAELEWIIIDAVADSSELCNLVSMLALPVA
jgi:hypothetical protein